MIDIIALSFAVAFTALSIILSCRELEGWIAALRNLSLVAFLFGSIALWSGVVFSSLAAYQWHQGKVAAVRAEQNQAVKRALELANMPTAHIRCSNGAAAAVYGDPGGEDWCRALGGEEE